MVTTMADFEQLLTRLSEDEAEVMRELDRRLALSAALMHKCMPHMDLSSKEYGDLLLGFFDNVDDFLDASDDDDDDDDD